MYPFRLLIKIIPVICLFTATFAFSQETEPQEVAGESLDLSHLSEETQALAKELEAALTDLMENGETLEKLERVGDLYARLGFAQRAVLIYEKAIRDFGGSQEVFLKFARVLLNSGKPDLALETLKIGREAFPDSEPLQLEAGKAYLSMRKGYAAQAIFKELIEKDPENDLYRYFLADSLRIQKKWNAAMEIAASLVEKQFDYPPVYLMKGELLLTLGKPGEGVRFLETVCEDYPNLDEAKEVLVHAYQLYAYEVSQSGQLEDALQSVRKSLEIDPKNRESRVALASLLSEKGEYEEAERIFQETLAEQPDFLGAYMMYGNLLNHLGRRGDAQAAYREGLKRSRKMGVEDAEQTFLDLLGGAK